MTTSNLVFELKTVQSNAFKTLVDAIKDILIETNIHFTKNGVLIRKKITLLNNNDKAKYKIHLSIN